MAPPLAVARRSRRRRRRARARGAGAAAHARRPAPRPAEVAWKPFVAALATHTRFRVAGELPAAPGFFDAPQIEQALINLLIAEAHGGTITLANRPDGGLCVAIVLSAQPR